MPTRRPHNKSRHGCQQCKKNRTKCDEKKPCCSRCERIGIKCSLIDPSSALIIISESRPTTQAAESSRQPDLPISPPEESSETRQPTNSSQDEDFNSPDSSLFHLSDGERDRLRLMTYYNQSTWKTIADLTLQTEEGESIWRQHIPDLAWKHDFLLHTLMSVSALHLAIADPVPDKHKMLAVRYHNVGLSLFRSQLFDITAENIDALFACGCLLALYSFGIHLADRTPLVPLAKIHEVCTLLRGAKVLVESGIHWLERGMWSPWFAEEAITPTTRLSDDCEEVFRELSRRIDTTITTSTQSDVYHMAIALLRENFIQATREPQTQLALVTFPIMVPNEILQMVCIGEPLSLCIIANYAVILHRMRHLIWIQSWGARTIEGVYKGIPSEWRGCIEWARRQIELDPEVTHLPTPM